jgi:hypothetical protein
MLQKLLMKAEVSLSSGDGGAAVEQAGRAFELFRSRHESDDEPRQEPYGSRLSSVRTLARLLADVDEAVAKRDPKSVQIALEMIRKALDIARRLEDSPYASGIRQRFPTKLAK